MTAEIFAGLAVGTLAILGTFLVVAAAIAGIGLLVRCAFGLDAINIEDIFLAFWTGYGIAILVLIVWNFFLPVGLPAFVVELTLGGVGLLQSRHRLAEILRGTAWRPNFFQASLLIAGTLWVANHGMAGFQSWDGALYHLQSVQWAETYAVVPGIANLHGPLAFNDASFLYDAMLDSGWWSGRGFHVANGVLVFVMVLQAEAAAMRFAAAGRSATAVQLYGFFLLAPALYMTGNVASYSTDVAPTLILLTATRTMYDLLDAGTAQSGSRENAYTVVALSILFATAVCTKLSAGLFAAVAMPVAAFLWWRRERKSDHPSTSALVWALLITLAFALPWITRGVVMSGYPLFPLSVAGFPVDWRAPIEQANAELAYIGFTEREFTWRIVGKGWLLLVFTKDIYSVLVPACLAAAAVLGLCSTRAMRTRMRGTHRDTLWLLLPVVVAIIGWLISAPSTRYSPALFWTLAAVGVCECQRAYWPRLGCVGRRRALAGLVAICISPPIVGPAIRAIAERDSPIDAVLKRLIIRPGPDHYFHPIIVKPEVTTYTTQSGLVVNVPKKPEASDVRAMPWNAPIPCTPNPAPNLQLRQPGRLDKGFRVDGPWQMQDWPYYWQDVFLAEWRLRRAS